MRIEQGDAVQLGELVRPPKGPWAVGLIGEDGEIATSASPGIEHGLFEIGSLTKTLTATLLATFVVDGTVSFDATVGALLGDDAGAAASITLLELATHTSGLPRLPPNAMSMPFWPRDPYRFYGRDKLVAGLSAVALKNRGTFAYSNLGYEVLGQCLAAVANRPFNEVLTDRVLRPAGMTTARCQPCERRGLVRARGGMFLLGGRRWHERLSGAGGVDASIADMAQWARANLLPETTVLGDAIRLSHERHAETEHGSIGLGWVHGARAHWHNGATGAFQSMIAVAPRTVGVVVLAGLGPGKTYTPDTGINEWLSSHLRAPD